MSDTGRPADLIPFAPHYRTSGVLVHITSLPSPYGVGDVGPPVTNGASTGCERC
jgi:4-alpha-glucanotransferase